MLASALVFRYHQQLMLLAVASQRPTVTTFQQIALIGIGLWTALVAVWFRRSTPFLLGGLLLVGIYTLVGLAVGQVAAEELGFSDDSWMRALGFGLVGLGVMLAYSPVADWLATRCFARPPTLEAFRALQESKVKLIAGIVVAWILGGFLEELILRGVVVRSLASILAPSLGEPVAAGIAISIAAIVGAILHWYQGPRAMVIIGQLSALFGAVFVIGGYNLWAVILCHGLYDTVAFIHFATKTSKYSQL
jgi:membrane protease YdiL (CAAX protease family)